MELLDLGEFNSLLKNDSLFRSYFEVHLNLPVFGQRFTYDVHNERITCHQPQNCKVHSVLRWVHQHRLPYFLRGPLYTEYLLVKELRSEEFSFQSLDSVLQFKRFLSGGVGYLLLHFALAVQSLLAQASPRQQRGTALVLLRLFTGDSGPFRLPDALRAPLLVGAARSGRGAGAEELETARLVRLLQQGHQQALRDLSGYWLTRFRECWGELPGALSSAGVALSKKAGAGPGEAEGAGPGEEEERPAFPLVQLLQRHSREAPPTTTGTRPPLPPLSTTAASLTSSRCGLASNARYSGRVRTSEAGFSPSKPEPLLPSWLPSLDVTGEPKQLPELEGRSQGEGLFAAEVSDCLLSSLQSDWWAGNPLLEQLRGGAGPRGVDPPTDCLLYWQGVQFLFLLDHSPPHKRNNPLLHPALHRRFAPYPTSLEELTDQHIRSSGKRRLLLPPTDRKRLLEGLPLGLGRGLLAASQRFAAKVLLKPWQQYLQADWESFKTNCCQEKMPALMEPHLAKKKPVPQGTLDQVLGRTYGFHSDMLMWKAFATAMLTCCHGVVGNLHPHIPTTGLRLLLGATRGRGRASEQRGRGEGWLLRHHMVPPTLTTISTQTTITAQRRTCMVLCQTLGRSSEKKRSGKKKPAAAAASRPKTFQDLLLEPAHRASFRSYLKSEGEGSVTPLDFWEEVSNLQNQMQLGTSPEDVTVDDIHSEYFTVDADKRLQCSEPIVQELARLPRVNNLHLLAAQGAVSLSLEERWYMKFLDHLSSAKALGAGQRDDRRGFECREKTKSQWKKFTRNVIYFRRGLRTPKTLKMFRRFLADEVNKALCSANHMTLVGNNVVNSLKLHNDLALWLEMERYRDMADIIVASKLSGSHSPEDFLILHRKAHAIVNCFVDSPVQPRVQVNIPPEVVNKILDSVAFGNMGRGLFHEATLNIFPILLYYWKKCCMLRFAPAEVRKPHSMTSVESYASPAVSAPPKGSFHRSKVHLALGRALDKAQGGTPPLLLEPYPVLSFSLAHGLRATAGHVRASAIVLRKNILILV